MEQLIFIGIIVFFSILEAVARKRKLGQGESGDLPAPLPRRPPEARRPAAEPAPGHVTYDADPSFDERVAPRLEVPTAEETTSEGLIPPDVWDEIAALARGEAPPAPRPAPPPRPASRPAPSPYEGRKPTQVPNRLPTPRPQAPASPPRTRPEPRAPTGIAGRKAPPSPRPAAAALEEARPDHALHASHSGYGEPVRGRRTAFEDNAQRRVRPEVSAARKLLSGGVGTLRQAVILSEILGPPASMKGRAEE